MAADQVLMDRLQGALAPLGEIRARAMFGGHCLYCDGTVFALLAYGRLWLKTDATTRARYEALGLAAFRPFPHKPTEMGYHPVPEAVLADRATLCEWAGEAVAVGRRAPARKPRKRRPARA